MLLEVDSVVAETHSLSFQAAALLDGAAPASQRDPPAGAHHPVPGNRPGSRCGKGPEGPANSPGPSGDSQESRHLPVGGHPPRRYPLDKVVDPREETAVAAHSGGGAVSVWSAGAIRSGRAWGVVEISSSRAAPGTTRSGLDCGEVTNSSSSTAGVP